MRVKCIGGPNDGEWYNVDSHFRSGDHYRIAVNSKLSIANYSPDYQIPQSVTIQYNEYVLHYLRGPRKEEFKYMTPYGAYAWDCLVKQLEK